MTLRAVRPVRARKCAAELPEARLAVRITSRPATIQITYPSLPRQQLAKRIASTGSRRYQDASIRGCWPGHLNC